MIAYIDASVLLRVALRQPDALPEWRQIGHGISSALIVTECLRTLDRLRLRVEKRRAMRRGLTVHGVPAGASDAQ
jgi:predicted nucleic acid-binding protein